MAIARSWVRRNRRSALRRPTRCAGEFAKNASAAPEGKTRPEVRRALGLRQCLLDALGRERGVTQARPGELGNRGADSRRHQWGGDLSGPGPRVVGRYQLDV